jgi:hypothetical protein
VRRLYKSFDVKGLITKLADGYTNKLAISDYVVYYISVDVYVSSLFTDIRLLKQCVC